jgi:hypothetical protein
MFCDLFYTNEFQRNKIFIYRVCNNDLPSGLFPLRGKRPFERHRLRWEDNTKMDIQEVG